MYSVTFSYLIMLSDSTRVIGFHHVRSIFETQG